MKKRSLICLGCMALTALLLSGCSSPQPEDPIVPPESKTISQSGTVAFPSGSTLNLGSLSVIGSSGTSTPSASGSFSVKVLKGYYSYIYVNSPDDKMVGAAYVKSSDSPRIDENSTALAITLMFPISWGEAGLASDTLMSEIQASADFSFLVSYVRNVMINDPTGLMDYSSHPTILDTAGKIVTSIATQHGLLSLLQQKQAKAVNVRGQLTVTDVAGSPNVHIRNSWVTPYGMSSFDLGKDPHNKLSYDLMTKLPYYVNPRSLKWWVVPVDGEADYALGDGNYVFMLSKTDPWALTAYGPITSLLDYLDKCSGLAEGDYIKVLQADSELKAFMGSMIFVTARVLGIVSVLDPTELTGFAALLVQDGPKAAELIAGIVFADQDWVDLGVQKSKTRAIKWLATIAKKNAKLITSWASKLGIEIGQKALQQSLENFTVIMDVVGAAGDLALLIVYAIDTFTADQSQVFFINQTSGSASIIASAPPVAPSVSGPTSGTSGPTYAFSVRSTDPDGDDIRYSIHYGDGTSANSSFVASDASATFTHSFPAGNYTIYCTCIDERGARSPLSDPHNISIYPAGGFLENFESYQLGGFESTGAWTVYYQEPSRVFISDVGMQSNRSLKFIDYDPSIGEAEGYYAGANAQTVGNATSVQFYVRVDNAEDAFGVRTWGTYGDWTTMGYYVTVDRGWFKWVKTAMSGIDDPTDFVPIMQMQPMTWYKVSLNLNWPAQTYSISVNDELLVSNATFVAAASSVSIASAPTLQLIAFTDAQCRSAYVDNISLAGATISGMRINDVSGGPALSDESRALTRRRR